MRPTEKTRLTRPLDSPDYVEFASLLRTRRVRIRQFQCCVCATLITVFVMTLVVTVSYSVTGHKDEPDDKNRSLPSRPANLTLLKLSMSDADDDPYAPDVSNDSFGSFFVARRRVAAVATNLTSEEREACARAGRTAMEERLRADADALLTPLPSPSPDSRQRLAVSTNPRVRPFALAAVAEIAATKEISRSRSLVGGPSPIGSFFDGGWAPAGACGDEPKTEEDCETLGKYRSYDGRCNRPMSMGAAMRPFRRSLPADYADGVEAPRAAASGKALPSAREVSLRVHPPSASSNPSFTVMLAVFGQFLDHDVTATALSQGVAGSAISCCPPTTSPPHPECFPVPIAAGDPLRDVAGKTCMEFVRSAPAVQCRIAPRQQLSQVSAFVDGSTIYGPDAETARGLREFRGGRLRMQRTPDGRTLLPASTDPQDGCNRAEERARGRYCFAAGDARANENLHLTTMHVLWARRHNRLADELAALNPAWDDETLYQEARRVVGAQLQHVAYQEFLPIVLGERLCDDRDLKPRRDGYRTWNGTDRASDPTVANNFAAAAFRFAHSLLPGLMRVTDAQKGTSSYVELHRMLFNPYSLYADDGVRSSVLSASSNLIQRTSTHVTSQLTRYLFEDPVKNTTVPCGLDLVSLNIQRGRDHGLPGYTKWREYCGLGKVKSFAELNGHLDPQPLAEIAAIYESVDDVDLYTGALAEIPVPGGIVGPTFTCLIAEQFERLQRGDRYWYELSGQRHSFTEDQLRELRKTSLAGLICECADGIEKIQASVMRSVGPDNPIVSCEDIAGPSMTYWKTSNASSGVANESLAPVDWTDLKSDINRTINRVAEDIGAMKANGSFPATDWPAFRDRTKEAFLDLKNRLAVLHPMKTKPIVRSATSNMEDWPTFKRNLMKTLNDSVANVGGGGPHVAQWIAFKERMKDRFADLKSEIASLADAGKTTPKLLRVPLVKSTPTIPEWVHYPDTVERSLDEALARVREFYGDESREKYTPAREFVELEDGVGNYSTDWLRFRDAIIRGINETVETIRNEMPPPGDPAWTIYRDHVNADFEEFRKRTFPWKSVPNLTSAGDDELRLANATQLAKDWLNFRAEIRRVVNRTIEEAKDRLTTVLDPAGWLAYRDLLENEFSQLKDDIETIKLEWSLQNNETNKYGANAQKARSDQANILSASYDKVNSNSGVTMIDWKQFKKGINDTVSNFVKNMKDAQNVTWEDFEGSVKGYFSELEKQIASLRNVISKARNMSLETKGQDQKMKNFQRDSINCYTHLNATMKDLADNLRNRDKKTPMELVDLLFEARANFSDLQSTNPTCAKLRNEIVETNISSNVTSLRLTSSSLINTAWPTLVFLSLIFQVTIRTSIISLHFRPYAFR